MGEPAAPVAPVNPVGPVDATYSLQRIAHEAGLGFKLRLVADVLKLTTTAVAEVLAKRLTP